MGDPTETPDWAQHWIEQQRALLERLGQHGATSDAPGGLEGRSEDRPEQIFGTGSQWAELGKTYLNGLLQLAQNAGAAGNGGAGAQFAPTGEMLDSWRSAWSNSFAQFAAPGGWVDLLNRTPPLGLFREQTEAWRAVAAAQADCQRLEQELAAVLRRVQTDALALLEEQIKSRAANETPVQGFRDLYDLWVECSEQVFSGVAHSSAYAHLQGELGNAAMRLRARIQKVIEQGLKQFDLPTRSELNSVHLQLRALKQRVAHLEQRASAPASAAQAPGKAASKKRSAPATRKAAESPPRRKRSR